MGKARQIELKPDDITAIDPEYDETGISFYLETWFDVDKYFGTETEDDEDVWINFYVFWNPDTDKYKALYTINSPDGNEEFAWDLTDEDIKVIKSAIEDYAKEEYGDISGLIEDYHNVIGE